MPIIVLAVLIFLIVMIVKYTHAALILFGSLTVLGITVSLVKRKLAPQESRTSSRQAAADQGDEWWKADWPGKS
jgi:hypothetical protein